MRLQAGRRSVRRAQRAGFKADYLIADAWFGTKPMIHLADVSLLTPILRMKKNAMKYRLTQFRQGQTVYREVDAKALYQSCIRGQWEKVSGQPYQAKTLDVELNLSAGPDEAERWIKVRLLFVRGTVSQEKTQAGKHDWAVFLTTAISLAPQRILELYALRWAIGVSREGHTFQSVEVRPRLKDSGLVAWEAPWRESKTVEPSDNLFRKEQAQPIRL